MLKWEQPSFDRDGNITGDVKSLCGRFEIIGRKINGTGGEWTSSVRDRDGKPLVVQAPPSSRFFLKDSVTKKIHVFLTASKAIEAADQIGGQ